MLTLIYKDITLSGGGGAFSFERKVTGVTIDVVIGIMTSKNIAF